MEAAKKKHNVSLYLDDEGASVLSVGSLQFRQFFVALTGQACFGTMGKS